MSENIKRPGMELNDAELAGVSGAGSERDYMMAAREVCNACPKNGQSCSSKLAHYMANVHEVLSPSGCPFSDEAKGG